MSRTRAATLIATNHVTVNSVHEKASYRTEPGDVVRIEIPVETTREITPESIPLKIVFEDEHLLVIDKPAGMVVHPAPGNWSGTVVNAVLGRDTASESVVAERRERAESVAQPEPTHAHVVPPPPTRAGLVHRLDKETSGLLIIARTEQAHHRLSTAIAARKVIRRYATMIWGHLDSDTLTVDRPIARDPRDRKRMAIVDTGKPARTDFFRLGRFGIGDLLRAHLHTGRTHQIRVHLAWTGHPVMGDDTYGGGSGRRLSALPPKRHFLHAAWLQFRHPITGTALDLRAPLPDDLRHSLATIDESGTFAHDPDPLTTLGFYTTLD